MKKIIQVLLLLSSSMTLYAQDAPKCSCPPIKMYVYDTRVKFKLDSPYTAEDAGSYTEAQNSGDWLEGDYLKQQSNDFQAYKGIAPGAKTGISLEYPPDNGLGPSGIDFTSFVSLYREGNPGAYTYNVALVIVDIKHGETVIDITQVAVNLSEVDSIIDALVASLGSVPDKLRDYQKKIRDDSNNTKWIGVKWKSYPDKLHLKIDETTKVRIQAFDCIDQKPVPNQEMKMKVTDDNVGSVDQSQVKTNSSGEATIVFKGENLGETRVFADFTYDDIYDETSNATSCSDQQDIEVANVLYKVTADFNVTGPEGIKYHFKGECNTYLLALEDGTFMLAPLDKSREMDLTILDAAMTSYTTFIGPVKYRIPFLFTIDKMDLKHPAPAPARLALTTICPSKGQVIWIIHGGQDVRYTCDIDKGVIIYSPGTTQVFPGVAGHPISMNGVTNLDILQYFGPATAGSTNTINMQNAGAIKEFAQRIQAHQNDLSYFKTAQGKADLQKMQALQRQLGNTPAPSYAQAQKYKNANAGKTPGSGSTPKVMPGMARVRVQDTFNPKSNSAFSGTVEGNIGPIEASIKVTVEREQ